MKKIMTMSLLVILSSGCSSTEKIKTQLYEKSEAAQVQELVDASKINLSVSEEALNKKVKERKEANKRLEKALVLYKEVKKELESAHYTILISRLSAKRASTPSGKARAAKVYQAYVEKAKALLAHERKLRKFLIEEKQVGLTAFMFRRLALKDEDSAHKEAAGNGN